MVTILCGKSGSGKDFLCNLLMTEEGYEKIVSTTTRPMRNGEIEGVSYFFVSRNEFDKRVKNGDIVEYRPYTTSVDGIKDTWYYGTSKEALLNLDPNKEYILIKDLEGAKAIQDFLGKEKCFTVCVHTSEGRRIRRAKEREGFNEQEWNRRFADDEVKFSYDKIKEVCDVTIANDGIDGETELFKSAFLMLENGFKDRVKENCINTEWGLLQRDRIKVEEYGGKDSFSLEFMTNLNTVIEKFSENVEYALFVAETKEEDTYDGNYNYALEVGFSDGSAETYSISLSYDDKLFLNEKIDSFIKERDNKEDIENDEHNDR